MQAFSLELPLLRNCKEDIPFIVNSLMDSLCQKFGIKEKYLSGEAFDKLIAYDRPGNIRELKNVLERAVVLSETEMICAEHIRLDTALPILSLHEQLKLTERQFIQQMLIQCNGDRKQAMQKFGLSRSVFYEKLKEYRLRWNYLDGVNPTMTVELPSHRKNKRASWTDQEARHALEVCVDPVLKLCMYLALGCSMRIGEILGLTWDSVHIDDELIQNDEAYLSVKQELRRCDKRSIDDLRKQGRDDIYFTFPPGKKTESTTVLVLKAPKTESSVRDIYIPAVVAEELKQTRARQEYMKTLLTDEYQDWLLRRKMADPWNRAKLWISYES